ncbi:hypothetical protein [Mesorhizobium sp.]|jgi:hypothetical protein|uniref:hypothetical protein n=1 Tax=Mesorhizobium sp. TaxID=1871066 RepID=UPI003564722F
MHNPLRDADRSSQSRNLNDLAPVKTAMRGFVAALAILLNKKAGLNPAFSRSS